MKKLALTIICALCFGMAHAQYDNWAVGFKLGEPTGVVLVFGRETGGLPAELHKRYRDRFVAMPMLSPLVRSLNLSTSVGIAVYEVLRQRQSGSGTGVS